ncbi:MAG: hypothetical protein ACYC1D_10150 [Acidimicrobiales bacterium]
MGPLLSAGLPLTVLRAYFGNPQTLLIIKKGHGREDDLLPHATRVMSFASFGTLSQSLSSGSIPAGVGDVLYDNEAWTATPPGEQQHPFTYAARAEALAHQHHLGLIFTPAADLTHLFDPADTGAAKYTGYLDLGFARRGAAVSDVLDIQGQQD